jgi:hypothetical protein
MSHSIHDQLTSFITNQTRDKMRVMHANQQDFFSKPVTRDEILQAAFEDVIEDIQDALKMTGKHTFDQVSQQLMDVGQQVETITLVDDPTYMRQLMSLLNRLPDDATRLHVAGGDDTPHAIDVNWSRVKSVLDHERYAEFLEIIDDLRDDDGDY